MTPADVAALDPGIRSTVLWLRAYGFDTTDSGDGRSKPEDERMLDVPHVMIAVEPDRLVAEAERLAGLVRECGVVVAPNNTGDGVTAEVHATYDPADRSAIIALIGFVR